MTFLLKRCLFLAALALMLTFSGCIHDHGKFHRLYGFCTPKNESEVQILASLGVKGLSTSVKPENIALLHKYGIEAYASFGPVGIHANVLTSDEAALMAYYNGKDLPEDIPQAERSKISWKRLTDANYSFGGEPVSGKVEVLWDSLYPCIIGEQAREKACKRLDKICATPGIDGIAFDYVGYNNYYGCQHPDCRKRCAEYLKKHNLPDTKANRSKFYLFELTEYYRVCTEYIKRINPEFRVIAHLYPVFEPHPFYGNQLQIDIAGETCAWYRIWDLEKVESNAQTVHQNQHRYYENTACIPFIGFSAGGLIDKKDAARVEQELLAILRSGTDALMIHELHSVLKVPEVLAVFRKYCTPEP